MSDVVERARARFTAGVVFISDGTTGSEMVGELLDLIPGLIAEVESLRTELKWVNA